MSVIFDPESLRQIATGLGYRFADPGLLVEALTHKSFANESAEVDQVKHNERLEFLGDSVLSLIISRMLWLACPDENEGRLSQMRAALVNKASLARVSGDLGLGEVLRLGRGEERTGGRDKDSILSDVFEAVLGALFLDGGLEPAEALVKSCLGEALAQTARGEVLLDPKSKLQELLQAEGRSIPSYTLIEASGPDHRMEFVVAVKEGNKELGRGSGLSKKSAEQVAAADALEALQK